MAASSLIVGIGASSGARAYCRMTTADRRGADNCRDCVTDGHPLAWDHPDIAYVFNERGFPGLDDAALRGVFARAFERWADVSCDGQATGLALQAQPGTTSLEKRDAGAPTVNVIGHIAGEDWPDDPFAFALTGVRFYPDSGRIAGADIWFNGGIGKFAVCPEQGCPDDGETVDLLNVATHETGHFLGLAHSQTPGATMGCQSDLPDTQKRSLEPDDRAGLCETYPPGLAFAGDYVEGKWQPLRRAPSRSCAAGGSAQGAGAPGLGLLALVMFALALRGPTRRG